MDTKSQCKSFKHHYWFILPKLNYLGAYCIPIDGDCVTAVHSHNFLSDREISHRHATSSYLS